MLIDIEYDYKIEHYKIRHKGIVYYIHRDLLHQGLSELVGINYDSVYKLARMSSYVIDLNMNTILKCRSSIEDLIDKYLTK